MSENATDIQTTPNADGRDELGRFVPGNTASKGVPMPHAKKAAEWRHAFTAAVSADDVMHVVVALVTAAKAGEAWAVRDLLDRTVGPSGKIDLNIGAGGALQVLILPPDSSHRSGEPLHTTGDLSGGAVVTGPDSETCNTPKLIDTIDGTGAARPTDRIDPANGSEEGGEDAR